MFVTDLGKLFPRAVRTVPSWTYYGDDHATLAFPIFVWIEVRDMPKEEEPWITNMFSVYSVYSLSYAWPFDGSSSGCPEPRCERGSWVKVLCQPHVTEE